MKQILLFVFVGWSLSSFAQHPPELQQLRDSLDQVSGFSCSMKVSIEVPGLMIPDKSAEVAYSKGEKPKIKADGLIFLPKKGMLEQYILLLDQPYQSIELNRDKNSVKYKLVSLAEKSDWITADVLLDQTNLHIHELVIQTTEFGKFHVTNSFGDNLLPSETNITFESQKIDIPLKFLGGKRMSEKSTDTATQGMIKVQYEDMKITF